METTNRHPAGHAWALGLALAAAGYLTAGTAMAATRQVPLPRPRPAAIANGKLTTPGAHNSPLAQKRPPEPAPGLAAFAQANTGMHALFATRAKFRPMARPVAGPFSVAPTTATSAAHDALVRQVIDAARNGKETDADPA